jgi:UbiD family decarboxylase
VSDPLFPDLRVFLDQLRRDRDLVVIDAEVDPKLEIAEIHRRVIAAGGPALLFTRPRGAAFPVVTNLFGTPRRAEMAFGKRSFRLIERLVELAMTALPPTPGKLWGARDLVGELLRVGAKRVQSAPVTEVIERDVDLTRLPALTTWPEDGGPFVTLPLVYTEHPAPARAGTSPVGRSNLGMYRIQIHDRRTTGMHWQIGKGGGFHYQVAEARGEALPVTLFVGGPPALILGAIAPLPENVPELLLASLLAGSRLPLAPGPDGHPHRLVGSAEFALCGRVPPHVRRPEGPFGDHYGYYSLCHDYPVFEVDAIARRRDAIWPATVVGKPRQEDFFLGDLLQSLLSPLFPLVMPGVEQLWSYGETGYHSLSAAVVKERYRREALGSAFRILGEGQLTLTKFLLVVDRHVDLTDFTATLEHLLARTRPETDLFVFANTAMDTLDYNTLRINEGSKGVWLGLGDPVRELPRTFSPPVPPPPDAGEVRVYCAGCLVVGGRRYAEDPGQAARLAAHPAFAGWPLVVLSDEPVRAARSAMNFLWTTFTRFDPAADLHAAATRVEQNHLARTPPIVIDARLKPHFPRELFADEATATQVSRRWSEYFPGGGVAMGDSGLAHLDPVEPPAAR